MIAMRRRPRRPFPAILISFVLTAAASGPAFAQPPSAQRAPGLRTVELDGPAGAETTITGLTLEDGSRVGLKPSLPLFSLLADGRPATAADLPAGLAFAVAAEPGFAPGARLKLVFRNGSKSKITLENLVPLGQGPDRTYITAGL